MASSFLLTVFLCAATTLFVRAMPIILLSRMNFPLALREWLNFVPAAIMAAIIVIEIMSQPAFTEAGWSISFLATLASFAVGLTTRSLFLTVLTGIAAFAIFGWVLP